MQSGLTRSDLLLAARSLASERVDPAWGAWTLVVPTKDGGWTVKYGDSFLERLRDSDVIIRALVLKALEG